MPAKEKAKENKDQKGNEPKPRFLVNAENISKYEIEEEPFSDAIKIGSKKGKKYFLKTIPTEANKELIENEKKLYTIGQTNQLATLHSVFEEGNNTTFVYKYRPGEAPSPITNESTADDVEGIAAQVRQFAQFLNALHKKNILYLRENPGDNVVIGKGGRVTVIGLDSASLIDGPFHTALTKIDAKPSFGTDWLVLGCFCNYLFTGMTGLQENGTFIIGTSEDAHDFCLSCFDQNQTARDSWNPFDSDYMKSVAMKVEVQESSITVDKFSIDWEDGFKFGFGDSYVQVNGDGLTIGSTVDDEDNAVTVGGDGFTLTSGDYKLNIGGEGVKVTEDHNGVEEELIVLGEEVKIAIPEHTITLSDSFCLDCCGKQLVVGSEGVRNDLGFKQDFTGGNFIITNGIETVTAGKDGVVWDFLGNGFSIGPQGIRMAVVPFAIEITISPIGIVLYFGENNSIGFVVGEGFKIKLGGIELSITGEGLSLSGEGLDFQFTKAGPKFINENGPFDFGSIEVTLPEFKFTIPQMKTPKVPPPPSVGLPIPAVPSVPIPKISFGGSKDEDAGKKLEECLAEGETIKKEEEVIKLGIFAKNKRKLIYTSNDRFFYTDPDRTVKGKVTLDKKAKFETKKDDFLKVVGPKAKYNFRFSGSKEREEWKKLFEEEANKKDDD